MNELSNLNAGLQVAFEAKRDAIVAQNAVRRPPPELGAGLSMFHGRLAERLSAIWGKGQLEPQLELIEREKFDGDIALKFPQLLKHGGPKRFVEEDLPWIVAEIQGPLFADAVSKVETKGMFINITLSDEWLLKGAQEIGETGEAFCRTSILADRCVVVDYSSPNVAKVLHAGHIRSTIVGHVLANLFGAAGATTYRVNHINDYGGFGFMLEGYRRFQEHFAPGLSENDRLLEVYRIRRVVERVLDARKPIGDLEKEDADIIKSYFPEASDTATFHAAMEDFVSSSNMRFAKLERGEPNEVRLWKAMVDWSLAEFQKFYDQLKVEFDFVIGESFYAEAGNLVIDSSLKNGTALVYTPELYSVTEASLKEKLSNGKINENEFGYLIRSAHKDIDAVVVPLENDERYVVRRADGASIYATRDLGAIALRSTIFKPTDIIYVVGQEQRVHFDRLFRASSAIGLAGSELNLKHLYFGFYVDSATGKKLSSRESVASVGQIIDESYNYFRTRLSDRAGGTNEELDAAARELALGSLVFNDLKQDIKGSVEINASNLSVTIEEFEKSGAAYVVYAACRARSILRKFDESSGSLEEIDQQVLEPQEAYLLLMLQRIPQLVAEAASNTNPSIIVRHLLDVAMIYNSYYASSPVIQHDKANPIRLSITRAAMVGLVNGLRLCHVECPEAI